VGVNHPEGRARQRKGLHVNVAKWGGFRCFRELYPPAGTAAAACAAAMAATAASKARRVEAWRGG
jgi:hypothetical protein